MFKNSEKFYEAIYQFKDYAKEAQQVANLIETYKQCSENTLLDVGCGIGTHLAYLKDKYLIEGLDLNQDMLNLAQNKYPEVKFYQGDMLNFVLGKQYGAVMSLFSSIGYVKTVENLNQTIHNLNQHLLPGGVLIIEAWFYPQDFIPNTVHALNINEPEFKLTRMNISQVKGSLSIMDMHYLVGTPQGVEHFNEIHEMGLFTHQEYLTAFEDNHLTVHYDPVGLMNRGLYLGIKPL